MESARAKPQRSLSVKPQDETLLILRRNRDNMSEIRFCHYLIGYFWSQLDGGHVQALRNITQDYEGVNDDAV